MRTYNPRLTLSLCALATGLLITACGGGTATPPGTTPLTSGFAIDGYLSGSTILCDINDNGAADSGENTTTTDSTGFYKFATECKAPVVATGGKSTDTLLDFTGKLKSPAGATVITPLTTLVASGMTMAQVNTALGLPASTDLLNTDAAAKKDGAYVNGDLFKKTLAVQQLLQQTTDVFANLGAGTAVTPALYSEVAKAMAAELKKGTALNSGTTVNDTVVGNIVKAAHSQVSNSALFTSYLKTQVAAVTAENLAQVTSASLKEQAEGLLKSTDTALVDKAKTSQTDTKIKDFVATNKTALATGASANSIATLASNLTDQVKGTNSGGGNTVASGSTGNCTTTSTLKCYSFAETGLSITKFGRELTSVIADDPVDSSNKVAKYVFTSSTDGWGGGTLSTSGDTNVVVPVKLTNSKIVTLRSYSPAAGKAILIKFESSSNSDNNFQLAVNTTKANAWETLTFDFTTPSGGTYDSSVTYDRVSIFPAFATTQFKSNPGSYYFDELTYPIGSSSSNNIVLLNFESSTDANLIQFGGAPGTVVNDPVTGSGKVAKVMRTDGAEFWAGTTACTTVSDQSIATIPFTSTAKSMTLRVYTPAAGIKVKLKVEDASNREHTVEADVFTTKANEWETLTFNFANQSDGTAALNLGYTFNKASVFFDFGKTGGEVGARTYYFDDLTFIGQ